MFSWTKAMIAMKVIQLMIDINSSLMHENAGKTDTIVELTRMPHKKDKINTKCM